MSPDVPSGTMSQQKQQAYDPTIMVYNNDHYVATAQPFLSG